MLRSTLKGSISPSFRFDAMLFAVAALVIRAAKKCGGASLSGVLFVGTFLTPLACELELTSLDEASGFLSPAAFLSLLFSAPHSSSLSWLLATRTLKGL